MKLKKTLLLLGVTILIIIIGSHWVSKKVSNRDKEIKQVDRKKSEELTTETIPPLDDENFIDTSDTIRVALHTTGFETLLHSEVRVTCNTKYIITYKNHKEEKKAGEMSSFSQLNKKITITPKYKKGRLTILSIKRNENNPSYRGKLTLYPKESKITVVNELSMEEYLYGVVPSEMPVSYGQEALKVQAVCARTYAMAQKNAKHYEAYHADVVDSTASQVYKNTQEDGRANQAVRDTKGKILMAGDTIASTYFFSTSFGYTTNVKDVWYQKRNEKSPIYLTGQFQGKENLTLNLKREKDFKAFINDSESYDTFEKNDTWYRWRITENLLDIAKTLEKQYPMDMKKIGVLKKIAIIERGVGGVVKICKIKGTKGSFLIEKENAIRNALAVSGTKILGQNKKSMVVSGLLPSGYFYITQKKGVITFHGGGFGHGVGMSQTGAMRMAEAGYHWEEILQHYFPETYIQECYT